ncbi:MAG: hypothetical protein FWF91_00810 [Coriobacteriia bacterium]|nr:hypothetical protein [Coriobacteriia bacterium]
MKKTPLDSPGRFQDPLGDYMKTAQSSRNRHLAHYPAVDVSYRGFYGDFRPQGKEGTVFLSSSEGIIGTELLLREEGEALGLYVRDNRRIAVLDKSLSDRIKGFLGLGWMVRCFLAYVVFQSEEKAFSAYFACFCYDVELEDEHRKALEGFIGNMTDRIASAAHPSLDLTQEQFVRVLESAGEWFLTKDEPWPELPKGSIYYKRRRTLNDRLIGAALKGNKGCVVMSWTATALIVAAVAFAIWFFFFSS